MFPNKQWQTVLFDFVTKDDDQLMNVSWNIKGAKIVQIITH